MKILRHFFCHSKFTLEKQNLCFLGEVGINHFLSYHSIFRIRISCFLVVLFPSSLRIFLIFLWSFCIYSYYLSNFYLLIRFLFSHREISILFLQRGQVWLPVENQVPKHVSWKTCSQINAATSSPIFILLWHIPHMSF